MRDQEFEIAIPIDSIGISGKTFRFGRDCFASLAMTSNIRNLSLRAKQSQSLKSMVSSLQKDVSDVDRLIIVPILLVIGYFIYRYVRGLARGEKGGCHGNCSECSQNLAKRVHKD